MIKDKQRDKRVNIGIGRFIGMQFVWGLFAGIARIVSPVLVCNVVVEPQGIRGSTVRSMDRSSIPRTRSLHLRAPNFAVQSWYVAKLYVCRTGRR